MQAVTSQTRTSACCVQLEVPERGTRSASLVSLFKAMGDETRLEMLSLMADAGEPLCVCHIESHFALSQPTISHHLRVLRVAGVVDAERRGTWMYYSILPSVRVDLAAFVRALPKRAFKTPRGRACT